jgi:hypothetical protein
MSRAFLFIFFPLYRSSTIVSWSVGSIREGRAETRRLARVAAAPTEWVQLSSVREFVSESVYVKFRFGPTVS